VTGSRSAAGTYALAFPTGTPIGTSPSFFISSPTGATNNPIVKISATSATGLGIVTQGSGFTNADSILSNTKINILSWPIISVIPAIGDRIQGGIVFYVDRSTKKGYVLYESAASTGVAWCTPDTNFSSIQSPLLTGVTNSAANTATIVATATGTGAATVADALSVTIGGVTYSDWACPSEQAVYLIYDNLGYAAGDLFNLKSFIPPTTTVWTSNQFNSARGQAVRFENTSRVTGAPPKTDATPYALAVREFSF